MKQLLLATTASIALIAGGTIVSAQSQSGSQPSASPSSPASGASGGGMGAGSARDSGTASESAPTGRSTSGGIAQQEPSGRKGRDAADSNKTQSGDRQRQGQAEGTGDRPKSGQRENSERTGQRDQSDRDKKTGQRDVDRNEKTGQRDNTERNEKTGQRDNMDRNEKTGQRDKTDRNERSGQREGRTGNTGSTSTKVTINTEQRSRIKSRMSDLRVGRVDQVDFSISVGTRVPRSVRLHAIPSTIVEIVPEWRRYRFVMVRDEIVIIDPDTFEIIAIIEA